MISIKYIKHRACLAAGLFRSVILKEESVKLGREKIMAAMFTRSPVYIPGIVRPTVKRGLLMLACSVLIGEIACIYVPMYIFICWIYLLDILFVTYLQALN